MTTDAGNEWIEFRASLIHGRGGFARTRIPAETQLIEYVGERIDKQESLRRCEANNPYVFELDDTWDVDGNVAGNPARWINHSCEPNAETRILEDRIWVVALRDIGPGEEITFNYNYDLEDYRDQPCACGAATCVGYMVAPDHFAYVRAQNAFRRSGGQSACGPATPSHAPCLANAGVEHTSRPGLA
jgi:hypothetical protein